MIRVKCPGRINIIGEHTDYSQGYVLPACINKYVMMEMTPSNDWRLHALDVEQVASLDDTHCQWLIYFIGVLTELKAIGARLEPMDIQFKSTIPIGAGLSSSSAITVAFLYGLNEYFQLKLSKKEMAIIAQKSEWHSGVKGGIMDQYAMLFGKKDSAIYLDCLLLEHEYIDCHLESTEWLLLNTNVSHTLSDSSYNDRKIVCHNGLDKLLSTLELENYQAINQVSFDVLEKSLGGEELDFVQYLWSENKRVQNMKDALKAADYNLIGKLLTEGHAGLSSKYRVSCYELDYLVEALVDNPDVYGSRMVGGGFGGCTLQLIKEGSAERIFNSVKDAYQTQFGINLSFINGNVVGGVELVDSFT